MPTAVLAPIDAKTHQRLIPFALLLVTCHTTPDQPSSKPAARQKARPEPSAESVAGSTEARTRWSPKTETLEAIAKIRSMAWRPLPQPTPPQRLTFFARNLGALVGDSVWALPVQAEQLKNPCQPNRLPIDSPRELTTLADQTLLVIGAKTTLIVDSNCQTTATLPKVSYIPGNRLLPEPRWPRAFALFDSQSGSYYRFRWDDEAPSPLEIFLPRLTLDDPNLRGSACALMRDGSLACVNGEQIVVGWPGYPTRPLGTIDHGSPVVRLLPAERADHVRVLRSNSLLEEYWLVPGAPKMRSFALPAVAFDVVVGHGYLAILQVAKASSGSADIRLVLFEADGQMRWSLPLESVPASLTEQQLVYEHFECRSIAAHPTRPWVAVGKCDRINLYDSRNGHLLQTINRAAH